MSKVRATWISCALCACALGLAALAPVAAAAEAQPAFIIESIVTPSNLPPEDESGTLEYVVIVKNVGSKATEGPVTITDHLPAGVSYDPGSPTRVFGLADDAGKVQPSLCEAGPPLRCTTPAAPIKSGPLVEMGTVVQPGGALYMTIPVKTEPRAESPAVNEAAVEGGGAKAVASTKSTPISAGIPPFGFQTVGAALTDEEGEASTRAGSHPYDLDLTFYLNTVVGEHNLPAGSVRDVRTVLPHGVVLNPLATPLRCTEVQLESNNSEFDGCPDAAAIGIAHLTVSIGSLEPAISTPLYNMVPQSGAPAELAFDFAGAGVEILVHIQGGLNAEGRYELMGRSEFVTQIGNAVGTDIDIWGSPSDPSHDSRRGGCAYQKSAELERSCPVGASEVPALSMPSACSGPLSTLFAADSWQAPGSFVGKSATLPGPGVEGCGALAFDPSFTARPTTGEADAPSGLEADLRVPQSENVNMLATSNLKGAEVTLPAGLVVNPSAANGLEACSEEQVGYKGEGEEGPIFSGAHPSCPPGSKLGTAEVLTPLLEAPLSGTVYLAAPHANPFGSLLALYLVVDDPRTGVVVKLAGKVHPDPVSGQLSTTFADNPELPFEEVKLDFFGGPGGTLRTPAVCGTHKTTAELSPWSGNPPVNTTDSFQISQGAGGGTCPTTAAAEPNAPAFEAGSVSPIAGIYSPFVLHLSREDGSQELAGLELNLPPGLSARLAGVPYCPEAALAAAATRSGREEQRNPSCPAASQVGTVTVAAGAGPSPYHVSGNAYLAGPYKGAPLSLAIITPAVAGPFDLGTVVVRTALQVNLETAQIHAVSDPLPTILEGIPLDVRSIALRIDRPSFTLNPTNCEPMAITGTATSSFGQAAQLSNRFQVGSCSGLGFEPQLKIQLKGATKRAGHPALKAVVTYPTKGSYANIARAQVALPHSEFLDQGNLNKVCTRPELQASNCPTTSIYGKAKAWTPLLEKPLEGPVYLGVGFGYKLPALVADLNGQVRILLKGKVDTTKEHGIRNTFEVVPDAPVSRFVLEMKGGKKYGLLENSENICRKPQRANSRFVAQNGRVVQLHPVISTSCKSKH
jgi:uncharacterized repeat protein (TIGR01451 family)